MVRAVFLFSLLIGTVILPFSGYAGVKDSIGVVKTNNVTYIRYLVSPGETIYRISTTYHVPISTLLELNPELEAGLKVGQIIEIPYNAALVQEQKEKERGNLIIHTVESGETLYSLSRKYNVSVEQLMKWNNLDLKIGQEVVIGHKDEQPVVAKEGIKQEKDAVPVQPVPPVSPKQPTQAVQPIEKTVSAEQAQAKPTYQSTIKETEEKEVVVETPVKKPVEKDVYPFDSTMQQVMIIPFNPYLYFSDADQEIATQSKIPLNKVRTIFRRRLTALMQAPGYETIYLLGGKSKDSIADLNKIYSSVTYDYQEIVHNPYYTGTMIPDEAVSTASERHKTWLERQKEKFVPVDNHDEGLSDKFEGKYFGVKITNPKEFFSYFQRKYSVDYFIFVNQFEVKTNYEHCLDRAANNYERTFTTHFSIFTGTGKTIAGNKFKTFYNSNSSDIYTIVADNMDKVATRILKELPPPAN